MAPAPRLRWLSSSIMRKDNEMKMRHDRHINRQHLSLKDSKGLPRFGWVYCLCNHGHDFWAVEGTRYVQRPSRLREFSRGCCDCGDDWRINRIRLVDWRPSMSKTMFETSNQPVYQQASSPEKAEDEGSGVLEYINTQWMPRRHMILGSRVALSLRLISSKT